jgi:hypothetical protein
VTMARDIVCEGCRPLRPGDRDQRTQLLGGAVREVLLVF